MRVGVDLRYQKVEVGLPHIAQSQVEQHYIFLYGLRVGGHTWEPKLNHKKEKAGEES